MNPSNLPYLAASCGGHLFAASLKHSKLESDNCNINIDILISGKRGQNGKMEKRFVAYRLTLVLLLFT